MAKTKNPALRKTRAFSELGEGPAPGSVLGHNRPVGHFPDPVEEPRFKALDVRKAALLATGSQWLKLHKIKTDEEADAIEAFTRQARALKKDATTARDLLRKPFADHVANINKTFNALCEAAQLIIDRVNPLRTQYLVAKQAAIDAEAKRLREEAEARQRQVQQMAERADPTDLTMLDAMRKTAEDAEAAQKEAARVAKERAGIGSALPTDSGVARSGHLRTFYSYKIAPGAQSQACAAKWHDHPKALALWEQLAREEHTRDRSWTFEGVTITSEQRAQ
jgi:hypothetical protein